MTSHCFCLGLLRRNKQSAKSVSLSTFFLTLRFYCLFEGNTSSSPFLNEGVSVPRGNFERGQIDKLYEGESRVNTCCANVCFASLSFGVFLGRIVASDPRYLR